jgi:uncharacterized protein
MLTGIVAMGCGDDGPTAGSGKTKPVSSRVRTPLPEALSQGQSEPSHLQTGSRLTLARRVSNLSAPARHQVATLTVRPAAQRLSEARSVGGTSRSSEAAYDQFVRGVVPLINNFWQKKTQEVVQSATYRPPGHLISYNGSNSPGCVGKKSRDMRGNAYYCASLIPAKSCTTVSANEGYCVGEDAIAWDKPGLLLPYYRKIGDLASALVLAHEWGHLIQARVFPEFNYKTTIRNELQADCYAGAWALGMKRQGRVNIGSFNQALPLFESVGGNSEAWLDPDSHGTQYQRIRSFTQGFEEDAQGCIGAKFDARLEGIDLGKES